MANASLKGEDKCCWAEATIGGEKVVFVMVADGHGGKEASAWLHEHLLAAFIARAGDDPSGAALRAVGRSVFIEAHATICAMKNHTAGSTLTVVAVNSARAEITTVNVGDSGALMIENSKAVPLSEDHRLEDNEKERERVTKLGGKLARAANSQGQPCGPIRVWPGGVVQARAVGDRDVGDLIDATPACATVKLPASADIFICSDGVWDALLAQHVAAISRRTWLNKVQTGAQQIVDEAIAARHAYNCDGYQVPRDDTTAVLVRIGGAREGDAPARREVCCF